MTNDVTNLLHTLDLISFFVIGNPFDLFHFIAYNFDKTYTMLKYRVTQKKSIPLFGVSGGAQVFLDSQ